MDVNLKQINLDKSNWKLVKFGDIAKEPKENVKDLHAEEIEHVVGLEHIDSEDIHLRRSANPETSTTFTKKFAKGDVLFGRRRAYLKKAAQAPFSGICSGDITVFRAKEGILPELLPFIVCNDKFFDYAVKHSAGGLSPRVKFKDLANYQFLLPPKDQQKQLAELLWAMDDVIEKERVVLEKNKSTRYCYFNNVVRKGVDFNEKSIKFKSIKYPESWEPKFLKSLLKSSRNGISETQNTNAEGIKVTRIETISEGVVDENKIGFVNVEKDYINYKLKVGDILFSHINSVAHIGKVALYDKDYDLYHGVNLLRLVADPQNIRYKFLFYHLQNRAAKYFFERRAKQAVNQASIDQFDLGSLPLAVPKLEIQDHIIFTMESFDSVIENNQFQVSNSKALQKSLINQIF